MELPDDFRTQLLVEQQRVTALHEQRAAAVERKRVAEQALAQASLAYERAQNTSKIADEDVQLANHVLASTLASLERRAAMISPILRLHDDLLLQIFQVPLALDDASPLQRFGRLCQPSFVAAAVCRRWRRVALSNTSLWMRLSIDASVRPEELSDYIGTILARSGTSPLKVTITAPVREEAKAMRDPQHLPQVISRASAIKLVLTRHSQGVDLNASILSILQLPTPCLRHLSLVGDSRPVVFPPGTTLLPGAPNLDSIALSRFSWRHVSHLSTRTLSLRRWDAAELPDLVSISASSPELQQLELFRDSGPRFPPLQVTLAEFSRLQKLSLLGFDFFTHVARKGLPALQSLRVVGELDTASVTLPDLPMLRELHLVFSSGSLIAILARLPQVTNLEFRTETYNKLSSVITRWNDPENIATGPSLESLSIDGTPIMDSTPGASSLAPGLVRLFESRAMLARDTGRVPPIRALDRLTLKSIELPGWAVTRLMASVKTLVLEG